MTTDEDLDVILRTHPTPEPGIDLAAVAFRRARAAAARRVRWWSHVVTAVAVVAVGVIATLVIHARLAAGGFDGWAASSSASDVIASATSAGSPPWGLVGAMMAVTAVVVSAGRAALDGGPGQVWAGAEFRPV